MIGSTEFVTFIPCFTALSPPATARLLQAVKEQAFGKGAVLLLEGEPCPGLFVVKSGSVKLYRSTPGGEEQIIRIAQRGACFECVPFFDGGTNPVSAQTLQPSTLYFLPSSDFQNMLSTYPEVALAFAPILARRLRSLVVMVGDYSVRGVYRRLARLLYQLSEPQGGRLVVSPSSPLSQQTLACMLGCSRQVVNSCLRRLVKEGVIRREDRHIVVLKPDVLRLIA